jgi:hypothetical protein
MSTPTPCDKPTSTKGWQIYSPFPGGPPLPLNDDGTVNVGVDDKNVGNSGYRGAVYNDGDSVPQFADCTELDEPPGDSTIWSGKLAAYAPPCDHKNVIFYNDDDETDSKATSFSLTGVLCGSGSYSDAAGQGAAALKAVVQSGKPVPASLSAQFGASPKPGGPRVEAALLVYSGAPGFERCWFSQPIDHRSDGAHVALWMLERTDARTWLLRLRRGGFDLVVYRHTAAVEKDGSLPVLLLVEGDGNDAGAEWPQTVTISPAP